MAAMAITSPSPPNKISISRSRIHSELTNNNEQRYKPAITISTNPSHVNINTLSHLYLSCHHSPHRFPSATADGVDTRKLAVAVAHSAVVVSVFAAADRGAGRREKGLLGMVVPVPVRVSPESGALVGFGRAISDLALTASIHDVMVIPSLRRFGFGRMIVQRIIRMLANKGIYDISALCSEEERLFFAACGFGDDLLGSTTMTYSTTAPTDHDTSQLTVRAGRKLLVPPPLRTPFRS